MTTHSEKRRKLVKKHLTFSIGLSSADNQILEIQRKRKKIYEKQEMLKSSSKRRKSIKKIISGQFIKFVNNYEKRWKIIRQLDGKHQILIIPLIMLDIILELYIDIDSEFLQIN